MQVLTILGNLAKRALIFVAAAVLCFLIVEAALLVFDGLAFRNSLWVFDPDMGFRVRSGASHGGSHRANSFGFNDDEYPLEKESTIFRILIIGDSFNWIGGRDWNYIDIVETELRRQFGEKVEVINTGYPATHPEEQLKMFEKFGIRYQPDLVVHGFFVGNDFIDSNPLRRRIAYGGEVLVLDPDEEYWTVFGKPVLFRSRLKVNLQGRWLGFLFARKSLQMDSQKYLNLERSRMRFCDPDNSEKFAPHVQRGLSSLRAMRDLTVRSGGEFMIIAYPDEFQVSRTLREEVINSYNLDASSYQWDRAQQLLRQFCAEEGIQFYDLLPAFQQADRKGQILYIPKNSHWNQEGNRLAADLISDILSNHL
jgi:hypothetical protein